jgi:hypothetical protein
MFQIISVPFSTRQFAGNFHYMVLSLSVFSQCLFYVPDEDFILSLSPYNFQKMLMQFRG